MENLQTKSVVELKALMYDLIIQQQIVQNSIEYVRQELQKKMEEEKAKNQPELKNPE